MSTVTQKTRYTPEDLLRMPDGDRYELVDGNLVERHMGFASGRIGGTVYYLLRTFSEANRRGWVLPADVGYQCFPDAPDKVRKPDVSFIRLERLAPDREPKGHSPIPPDLAVEVVSPNDLVYEVDAKVAEYLAAGVRLVWVIHPQSRTMEVHRLNGPSTILQACDELSGEDVVPGFRCRVEEIFKTPA